VFGLLLTAAVSAQQGGPQLVVSAAVPDPDGETISITGENFGGRPFVTLDLVPLTIRIAIGSQILAEAPVGMMPAGEYLLTVSRGPSAVESASFQLVVGGEQKPPAATTAPTGTAAPPSGTAAAPGPASPGSAGQPAAQVGDRLITMEEIDREWRKSDPASFIGLRREMYEIRRRIADTMITDELLAREAKARSVTVDALLKEEIPKRTVTLPESAIVSLYQGLGDRTRSASLDQMRPALRAWLERITEPELAKMSYLEELKKTTTRAELLVAAPRVEIERAAQDAALGPADAVVQLVVFGDFQSSEYLRLAQAFDKVRETFGSRLRLVFKHLPALGSESAAAAEAAQCANLQNRFWAYHDTLLLRPGALTAAVLKLAAAPAGLAQDAFDRCVDRGEAQEVIRQALLEAARYGLQDSPRFLVNGRLAPPPPPFLPPFDYFKRLIEEELAALARKL
jgi:protein-disulfide isomerase